ncbi:putative pyridoxamine 5'-phosphate oxidase [Pseudomonas aeruginosa]|nr:putative pyridoxamine 5'-phosphate oxidase [Pseudomonas aeruginosa]
MGVNANISESLTGTIEAPFPEFEAPPANPMEVLRNWLERARRYGVREPRALALATVDGQGRPSTRIVVIAELGERGVVFATHADSQKGRELAQNPWASGVLYWRESSQQIILNGRAERLPDERADAQWLSRPYQTHPMSIASRQSETLADIHALRAEARRLAETDGPLPRRRATACSNCAWSRWSSGATAPSGCTSACATTATKEAGSTATCNRDDTADRCAGVSRRICVPRPRSRAVGRITPPALSAAAPTFHRGKRSSVPAEHPSIRTLEKRKHP